ncbi:sulfite exporter TauE/SafE family protein [Desulfoscipio gibsoniae]|uniref:Probable membrane transporter protein n=1 Tax=Desulfoscipio gibsoniae DSM 7213 TaxID=767817 RepID=R4KIK5_9FIRM|nr:sulfite exporter TauE/SafE family protein [Desulfoscipio gibsoniae]AGL03003.1 putative permease [Desulfoscipio gibsoniae DSM 7213]
MRKIYEGIMQASRSYAQWEIANSNAILRDRKRVMLLFVMLLPVIIPAIAHAAGGSGLPEVLGGKSAYGPSYYNPTIFYGSILVGLAAGLITGCVGAGGGFIITPALMTMGVKGIMAVGTDQFHIFAKSIMGTVVHKKLGNVHVGLAIAFLCGSLLGVTGGGMLNRALFTINPVLSGFVINTVYVIMLGFLAIYALNDFFRTRKSGHSVDAHGGGGSTDLTSAARKMQSVKIPPMITFDEDIHPGGKKISGVFVAICGAIVGFMAAIMGVGGGFLTFPMFVYGLGVSSFTTVGTDILQIIFTAGFGAITQYAIYGYVFYTLAMGMLVGSLLGIQVGAMTTKVVSGATINGFYAITILAGFVNRLFDMPNNLQQMGYISISSQTASIIAQIGAVIFFAIVGIFAAWVIAVFIKSVPRLREEAAMASNGKGE